MKKLKVLLSSFVAVMLLFGCSESENESSTENNNTEKNITATDLKISPPEWIFGNWQEEGNQPEASKVSYVFSSNDIMESLNGVTESILERYNKLAENDKNNFYVFINESSDTTYKLISRTKNKESNSAPFDFTVLSFVKKSNNQIARTIEEKGEVLEVSTYTRKE